MKDIKDYIYEANYREDPEHKALVKEFPESEGWIKVYHDLCVHNISRYGNYQILVYKSPKKEHYTVKWRCCTDIVEYPKEWEELKVKEFDNIKDVHEFIDNNLYNLFNETDPEYTKKYWRKKFK